MFTRSIISTPFTGDAVDTVLGNISYSSDGGSDLSFLATVRALLLNRLGKDEEFKVICNTRVMNTGWVERTLVDDCLNYLWETHCPTNEISVVGLRGDTDDIAKAFNVLDAHFLEKHPSYKSLEDCQKFVSQFLLQARFYIDEEAAKAYVVYAPAGNRYLHFIQALVPRLVPKLFKEKPFNDLEKELAQSLAKPDGAAMYINTLTKIKDASDIQLRINAHVIEQFERNSRVDRLSSAEREVSRIRSEIRTNIDIYRSLIKEMEDANIRLEGIKAILNGAEDDQESPLTEFIASNKNIDLIGIGDGGSLEFIVSTWLDSVDPEMYETYSNNRHSSIVNDGNSYDGAFTQWENRKKVLDALFSAEPTMRLRVCVRYNIWLRGDVEAEGYSYPDKYRNYMRNPHIEHHACLGDHRRFINEKLREGDVVGAIMQCFSSARSLNIGESATTHYFLYELFHDKYGECIELPDGSFTNSIGALEYLNREGNA